MKGCLLYHLETLHFQKYQELADVLHRTSTALINCKNHKIVDLHIIFKVILSFCFVKCLIFLQRTVIAFIITNNCVRLSTKNRFMQTCDQRHCMHYCMIVWISKFIRQLNYYILMLTHFVIKSLSLLICLPLFEKNLTKVFLFCRLYF